VISSFRKEDDRAAVEAGGALVTVAFQALASPSPTDGALPADAAETVAGLAACALGNIKRALRCEGR
jgi:homeobox-leucine zipper protein